MRIADVLGLSRQDRAALFSALLMKDLGCSSNSARFAALFGANDHDLKADLTRIDWSKALESFRFVARNAAPGHFFLKRTWRLLAVMARGPEGAREVVQTRCERGADIARMLGLADATVHAIRALDEHWDGQGQPYSKRGEEIPLLARVLGLAQTVEVFFTTYGVLAAYDMAAARRGTWFDPCLVDALFSIRPDAPFWRDLGGDDDLRKLSALEPEGDAVVATEDRLDAIAEAFARVIDAKSPWTYQHSTGVADTAVAIGQQLGLSAQTLRVLRRTALLHDLGKLGVSNLILDKPAKLTDDEFRAMKRHPEHTSQILARVSCFAPLVENAAAHHERLDGRGYHRGLDGDHLSLEARVLAVADISDALRSSRPYRAGLPEERVIDIMRREMASALDPRCVEALETVFNDSALPGPSLVPAAQIVTSLAEDYAQAA
jgi:HD-GYP domain-containing protein (c-di-GMP phosphodiesterase class II)